ncbi:MAG TPA: serine hydrolase domain-containing protein [Chitinophagaceae bacterium]|nr:serine hydrolase domain-containing protein [Chitinophagaceae bacterium]
MTPIKLLLCCSLTLFTKSSLSQALKYTAQQATSIHDSIHKSRWDIGGGLSHYSFRHMSEFFPVAIIQKSQKPHLLPLNIKKPLGNIEIELRTDTVTLEHFLRNKHVSGFIVVQNGAIIYEQYSGMLPGDQHTLQSVTKVITATIITQLAIEGKLLLTNPIDHYIPELKGTAWQGISIKDILDMNSGIEGAEINGNAFTNAEHPYYKFESALGVLPRTKSTPASVYQYITTLKKLRAPGTKPEYHSVNTFILGWLAEKLTGSKYTDIISEKIWKPMGAESDAYVCLSDTGVPWFHGGISATLRDLARFGMLYTSNGIARHKGKIVTMPQIDAIYAGQQHAFQWDFAKKGEGILKTGFGNQGLYIHPEKNIVIAYFNYVDKDWNIINMLPVVKAVVKAIAPGK